MHLFAHRKTVSLHIYSLEGRNIQTLSMLKVSFDDSLLWWAMRLSMLQKCLEIVQAFINNANKQSYQQSKLSTARICISVKII